MKKILKRFKHNLKNAGSGLILVIVALGFIGILCGALLTAVQSVYRLKNYDYNAKSNFYYLEQAMDEIYAGLGSKTMSNMREAYEETREQVVYYDTTKNEYKNLGNEEANKRFKDNFMDKISSTDAFNIDTNASGENVDTSGLVKDMKAMISNPSVHLDYTNMKVYKYGENGKAYVPGTTNKLAKIVIKNVKLFRDVEYKRSSSSGKFEQAISTDIEISRPDFEVDFETLNIDTDTLFSYTLIADQGVEFNQNPGTNLVVNGNVYAANDFYNKAYNKYTTYTQPSTIVIGDPAKGRKVDFNKVDNKAYSSTDDDATTLYNANLYKTTVNKATSLYDGRNLNSKYSGFYVNGSNVTVLADTMIVPGSISVMNAGDLVVFGKDGSSLAKANVWTDEVVLAGDTKVEGENNKGSEAVFNANLFVKDDTQIESDNSNLSINGKYYGYSNSNTSDNRSFIPTTAKAENGGVAGTSTNIYQEVVKDSSGADKIQNRGHYNSSSIIVNSKNSVLNLTKTEDLYLAGRSYIELSKYSKTNATSTSVKKDAEGNDVTFNTTSGTTQFDSKVEDYRTGESLSLRSNQLAYLAMNAPEYDEAKGEYFAVLPASLSKIVLFQKYFGGASLETNAVVPVKYVEENIVDSTGAATGKKKKYIYLDFDYAAAHDMFDTSAYNYILDDGKLSKNTSGDYLYDESVRADVLKENFIKDYFDFYTYIDDQLLGTFDPLTHTDVDSDVVMVATGAAGQPVVDGIKANLRDVTNYSDFVAGQIAYNSADTSVKSYASGVLTTSGDYDKTDTDNTDNKFKVVSSNNQTIKLEDVVKGTDEATKNDNDTSTDTNVVEFSKNLQKHYGYVRFTLKDLDDNSDEAKELNALYTSIADADKDITPINYYLNIDDTNFPSTDITPDNLKINDGKWKVWVANNDVSIEADSDDNGVVTGIVIAKGDVYFNNFTTNASGEDISYKTVKEFNGIIIAGGKVYVNNSCTKIFASNLCKNIINECINIATNKDNTECQTANKVLKVFKDYKSYAKPSEFYTDGYVDPDAKTNDTKNISNIDYSQVVKYNNWMRNVSADTSK